VAVRFSAYVNLLAPAGGPSALTVLTAVLGAEAPVADAFAAGFLPPVILSLECGPFGTVLVRMLKPVFSVSVGFFESSRLCVLFLCILCCFHNRSHELPRRGKVRPGRDPPCPGKTIEEQGVAMALSTPFETGLVFDPGPLPG